LGGRVKGYETTSAAIFKDSINGPESQWKFREAAIKMWQSSSEGDKVPPCIK
jgi:hypothetical protein